MKILNFGSLNIDDTYAVPHFVSAGETLTPTAVGRHCGGKGLNQSVALARAGAEVYHAGCVGEDGGFLLDCLRDAGVDCRYVRRLADCPTGRAMIQVTPEGQNCILLSPGANRAIAEEQREKVLSDFCPGDVLLLQNEINGLSCLLRSGRARGLCTVWNPSPCDSAAEKALADCPPDWLILNEVEAVTLTGATDPEQALEKLNTAYPDMEILLTLGTRGSVYRGRAGEIRQSCFHVKACDTTGAGDTYTGYFLAAMTKGGDALTATGDRRAAQIHAAMALAARASAVAVTKPGAADAIPTAPEIAAFPFEQ